MPTDNQEPIGDGQETETGEEQGQVQDGGEEVRGDESAAMPEAESDDIALEDDEELDVEIAEVAPRRRSCGAPLAVVFVIAVLVAAALWGKSEWDKKQQQLQANEEQAFVNVQATVNDTLAKAADLAKDGKVQDAYQALGTARDKVATAARAANSSRVAGHEDRAKRLLDQGSLLGKIIADIDADLEEVAECDKTIEGLQAKIDEAKGKREKLESKIGDRIMSAAGVSGAGTAEPATTEAARPAEPADKAAPAAKPAAKPAEPAAEPAKAKAPKG